MGGLKVERKKTKTFETCCIHLLSISKVLEAVDAPFQSYGGLCP